MNWYKQSKSKPVVIKEVVKIEKVWICPHCEKEIGEKGMYYDGKSWFHRECGEEIETPGPTEEDKEILKSWGIK